MTPVEFAEMVDYLEDRFPGRMKAWEAAGKLVADYQNLPSELVWTALLAKLDSDPKADWPPTSPALRAAVLERMRYQPQPQALPESTDRYTWAEFSQRTYGRVVSLREAVELAAEKRHA